MLTTTWCVPWDSTLSASDARHGMLARPENCERGAQRLTLLSERLLAPSGRQLGSFRSGWLAVAIAGGRRGSPLTSATQALTQSNIL